MCRRLLLIALTVLLAAGCNLRDDGVSAGDAGGDTDADAVSGDCTSEQTEICAGECVDLQTNVEHCGACGNNCAEDARNNSCVEPGCEAGACVFDASVGGSCELESGALGVCAEQGCVGCVSDEDCTDPPTSHTECWVATCTDAHACDYDVSDPEQPCGSASCTDGFFREPDLCGDTGSCNLRDPGTECAPFICNEAGDACSTSCEDASDCVDGAACLNSQCATELAVDMTIDADVQNVVVSEEIASRYSWDGSIPVVGTITIAASAAVGSTSNSQPAFLVDALPDASELTIIVDGMLLGAGGKGGDVTASGDQPTGFVEPTDGGPALEVAAQEPNTVLEVENRGIIGGGGGGGAAGSTYIPNFNFGVAVGGGGGAGYAPGDGGVAPSTVRFNDDGDPGGRTSGGAGGRYEGLGGGRGGSLGGSGGPVDDTQQSSSRGSGGPAIVGESNFDWVSLGDVRGSRLP
ncbi:MAG: hypothetical protein ACQEVA_03580 [Myxococcota bacterium]